MDNRIQGAKSLCSIDLRRHKLFNTTTPAPKKTTAAPKGKALALNKIRLPSPSLSMRTSDSDLKDQRIHFFPAADRRAFCLDQLGRGFLLEADTPRMVMMPCLHRPKLEPIALYIPLVGPDFDDLDGGGGGNLFIMDRRVAKPEPGGVSDGGGGGGGSFHFQFEALVYRKPWYLGYLSKTWHCDLLPPLPPHVGGSDHSYLEISSYAVVGSQVCISVDGDGTYCLTTVNNTYCWSEVGKWTLPFQGQVHYAPELKLWFGFTAEDQNLAAADLSSMDSRSQPHLLNSWKELEPPKGWQQVQDPQLVSLGSGMFCIARFFRTGTAMDDCQNVTVLTGVEVVRGVNVLPGTADLRMVKHKSLCHKSGSGEDTITTVF